MCSAQVGGLRSKDEVFDSDVLIHRHCSSVGLKPLQTSSGNELLEIPNVNS